MLIIFSQRRKMELDKARETRKITKPLVIDLVLQWAEERLERYEEPSRAGTPKGEPIGLSRKKFNAALLMVLHPNCLKLKEIAKIAKVSEGVLRVWRTKEQFRKVMEQEHTLLGEAIANTMEYNMKKDRGMQVEQPKGKPFLEIIHGPEDPTPAHRIFHLNWVWLVMILPFVSSLTSRMARQLLRKNLGEEFFLVQAAHAYSRYTDEDSLREYREYERKPEELAFTMAHIASLIDLLADPETKQKENVAKIVKDYIFAILKILAS